MIDIHCHLEFIENPIEVIETSKGKMKAILTSVADPKNARAVFDLEKKYPNFLFVTLGFHPEYLLNYQDDEIEKYIEFIKNSKEKICAIGEVGMDFSKECEEIDKMRMRKVFVRFINLAKELNLPLVIHARDAFKEVLEILKELKAQRVCLHCFSGSEGILKEALRMGYFISFATNVCYTKKHPRLAEKTPIERMLLETDSPWLDPENPKSLTNRPWKIFYSAKVISEIKKIPPEKVLEITTKNAIEFFNLKF